MEGCIEGEWLGNRGFTVVMVGGLAWRVNTMVGSGSELTHLY